MEMFKVYIDLGHGGNDSGALNKARNVLEKNVVLEVGKLVDSKLRKCGLDVKLSRTNDITKSLQQRTNEANAWGADCLVSIHVNDADNRKAKGLETYCYKIKYRKLADFIQEECVKAGLYTQNRGVKEGNLHMVRESKMSAALIELFFINNEEDINKMLNKKEEFATAIAKGICKFLGVSYVESGGGSSISPNQQFPNGEYQGRKAIVTSSELNVRYDRWVGDVSEPKKVGKLKKGDIVDLGYCLNGWPGIHGFKGNKGYGYVNSKYLKFI
ncbi:N-acetylmuramoyl-L-alanine amidase [Paraclostridium bifermentans]|uniref:N-acetylmuramoyl-L-alanine amidase n=1 Tax=Paraclostridium bifermentans TaxID=1490 RepID=UPI001476EF76|nr:N-acetylmuramoyl-L-alanine amidase [Paraclostridium bifermentans]